MQFANVENTWAEAKLGIGGECPECGRNVISNCGDQRVGAGRTLDEAARNSVASRLEEPLSRLMRRKSHVGLRPVKSIGQT
ncbi:hypothetical protein WDM22_00675 [Bradyrhizobium septentrionale]|uniref:hypothetical protein n=1 Tax=Bradyrhizobium septentrionale TaxID=1404411 RepID=UPI0030D3040C